MVLLRKIITKIFIIHKSQLGTHDIRLNGGYSNFNYTNIIILELIYLF